MAAYFFLIVFSYALGMVPSEQLVGLRAASRRLGRPNTVYGYNLQRGLSVLGLDFLKGVIATLTGLTVAGWSGASLAAVLVNAGTLFPVFFAWRGRGTVGTAAGALLVLSPVLLLTGLGAFLVVLLLTQYLSLSLVFSTVVVLIFAVLYRPSWLILLAVIFLAAGVLYVLKGKYARFLKGKETPFPLRRMFW